MNPESSTNKPKFSIQIGRKLYEVWYRKSLNDIVKETESDLERDSKFMVRNIDMERFKILLTIIALLIILRSDLKMT